MLYTSSCDVLITKRFVLAFDLPTFGRPHGERKSRVIRGHARCALSTRGIYATGAHAAYGHSKTARTKRRPAERDGTKDVSRDGWPGRFTVKPTDDNRRSPHVEIGLKTSCMVRRVRCERTADERGKTFELCFLTNVRFVGNVLLSITHTHIYCVYYSYRRTKRSPNRIHLYRTGLGDLLRRKEPFFSKNLRDHNVLDEPR